MMFREGKVADGFKAAAEGLVDAYFDGGLPAADLMAKLRKLFDANAAVGDGVDDTPAEPAGEVPYQPSGNAGDEVPVEEDTGDDQYVRVGNKRSSDTHTRRESVQRSRTPGQDGFVNRRKPVPYRFEGRAEDEKAARRPAVPDRAVKAIVQEDGPDAAAYRKFLASVKDDNDRSTYAPRG